VAGVLTLRTLKETFLYFKKQLDIIDKKYLFHRTVNPLNKYSLTAIAFDGNNYGICVLYFLYRTFLIMSISSELNFNRLMKKQ